MNPSTAADRLGRTVVRIDRGGGRATNLLDGLAESLTIDARPKGVIVGMPGDDRVIVRWASGATEDLPVGSVLEVWWSENLETWVTLPDE